MATHSPLPWHLTERFSDRTPFPVIWSADEELRFVCVCNDNNNFNMKPTDNLTNGRFIVTAVNSHASLTLERDRLRTALVAIEKWEDFPPVTMHGRTFTYGFAYGSNGERDFMRSIARSALAAANEGRRE